MRRFVPLLLGGLLLAAAPSLARTWHIFPDGSGDAPTIRAGVDSSAIGDTLLLAPGDFAENDISIPRAITIRSENGDPNTTRIVGGGLGQVLHVNSSTPPYPWIEGITIAEGASRYGSGGLAIGGGLTLRDCIVRDCRAGEGAGAYVGSGQAVLLEDCVFLDNVATDTIEYPLRVGGGALKISLCDPVIRRCTFSGNEAQTGGAILTYGSNPLIEDCRFLGNRAEYHGGGMASGPHHSADSSPTIRGCLFRGNTADWGGGGYYDFYTATSLRGCLFLENTAGSWGGGAFLLHTQGSVRGCTFVSCAAGVAGGGIATNLYFGGLPVVLLEIERTLVAFCEGGPGLAVLDEPTLVPDISCTDLFGNSGGDWVGRIADQAGQDGNLSADPLFCSPETDDYHLQWGSPCLPHNSGGCDVIGRFGFGGCNSIAVTPETWGGIKARYREPAIGE